MPLGAPFQAGDLAQAFLDCRRHKRNTPAWQAFEADCERHLVEIEEELRAGTYRPGPSNCFVVTHPKPREVWAAQPRDRVAHHLLYNHIAQRFHNSFEAASSACIPGRGTLYAANRLEHDIRSITRNWKRPARYLKCDLSNFFVSIKKPVLRELLAERITEPWWLWLAETILFHDPRTDVRVCSPSHVLALVPPHKSLFNAPDDAGLPIGNLSSQFFANVLLDPLDKFVKHQLRCKHYIRYVDDFVLLHEDPQWLSAALARITAFLPERLELNLNPTKTIQQPVERGIDFVGHVIKPWCHTTRRRTLNTALRRLEHMEPGDVFSVGNSYLGLMGQAQESHTDRARICNALRRRGHAVSGDLSKAHRSAA
ncbi:MAG: RNA-directed DNA polymerase [Proteobacteria bacterium]|nr:RNA-directed DNA polymerase [Pseudomonadota bacterium]